MPQITLNDLVGAAQELHQNKSVTDVDNVHNLMEVFLAEKGCTSMDVAEQLLFSHMKRFTNAPKSFHNFNKVFKNAQRIIQLRAQLEQPVNVQDEPVQKANKLFISHQIYGRFDGYKTVASRRRGRPARAKATKERRRMHALLESQQSNILSNAPSTQQLSFGSPSNGHYSNFLYQSK